MTCYYFRWDKLECQHYTYRLTIIEILSICGDYKIFTITVPLNSSFMCAKIFKDLKLNLFKKGVRQDIEIILHMGNALLHLCKPKFTLHSIKETSKNISPEVYSVMLNVRQLWAE